MRKQGIGWDDLISMVQDRDAWKMEVFRMQREVKAKPWRESATEEKLKRKEGNGAAKPKRRKILFTFLTKCKMNSTHHKMTTQRKRAHDEFLTGIREDRCDLQNQAKRAKQKAKRKREKVKQNTKKVPNTSTYKYTPQNKQQTDIRQFMATTTPTPNSPTQWAVAAIPPTPTSKKIKRSGSQLLCYPRQPRQKQHPQPHQ